MKSKILLFILVGILSVNLSAQKPKKWTESLYDPNKTSVIERESVIKNEGSYSIKYIFTDDGTPYMICDTFTVTAGASYNFSIDYLDNDAAGAISARIWFFSAPNTAYLNRYTTAASVDSPNWQTITYTGTVPATATLAYVAIRMSTTSSWAGSALFYADKASYTENGGPTNHIQNPGFEEWDPPVIETGSSLDNWTESLYNTAALSTIEPDATTNTEGFFSLKYTFTDDGTPYMICDTFTVTAGASYNFSIDYLDNNAAGAISARIWFFSAPNTAYLNRYTTAATVDSPNWQTITYSGTVPATATLAYVAIRMSTTSSWAGSATFNADKAIYSEGGGSNHILNPGFEKWTPPTAVPEIKTYSFEGLTPIVNGTIDKNAHTVNLAVPFATTLTNLVATYTLSDGATAKVGATNQVSGTTANDFTSPVVYTLTGADATTQDWTVTVTKNPASTSKAITSFVFEALTPDVFGVINATQDTITLSVPTGTNVTALVPTITVSEFATVAPESGAAQDFTNPVVYTVTAQDASTKTYKVVVKLTSEVTLFQEYFENVPRVIPAGFKLIDNDHYTHDPGDARWIDSAWVVTTSSRPELTGNHVAVGASIYTDMPLNGKADDWMILPAITVGANSTLSWKAMSLTTSGNYPDDYRVIAAPSSSTVSPSVSYFETYGQILQTVAPESWSAAVGNPGQGLQTRSINLKDKGYTNQSIWIAFVLTTDLYTNPTTGVPNTNAGGSALAIDEIKVVEGAPSTGINDPKKESLHVNVYPNPTHGIFNVAVYSELNSTVRIEVVDLIGRIVYTKTAEVGIGKNTIELNASELNNGLYLIQTKINDKVNVSKLMVK